MTWPASPLPALLAQLDALLDAADISQQATEIYRLQEAILREFERQVAAQQSMLHDCERRLLALDEVSHSHDLRRHGMPGAQALGIDGADDLPAMLRRQAT